MGFDHCHQNKLCAEEMKCFFFLPKIISYFDNEEDSYQLYVAFE